MQAMLYTLEAPSSFAQEIRRSRFLAFAAPIGSEADARAFLAERSDPAASHNCWAWRIGQAYRFNDDGEPGGTAGRPILQAIEGQAMDRVAVLVVRWFGGTLLGSGGLVRAYGGTAANCLREGRRKPLVRTAALTVQCAFGDLALLRARIGAVAGASIVSETFGAAGADLRLVVPEAEMEAVARMIADLTSGRAVVVPDA